MQRERLEAVKAFLRKAKPTLFYKQNGVTADKKSKHGEVTANEALAAVIFFALPDRYASTQHDAKLKQPTNEKVIQRLEQQTFL